MAFAARKVIQLYCIGLQTPLATVEQICRASRTALLRRQTDRRFHVD